MTLGFLSGSKNFCKLCFLRRNCFCTETTGSIGWPSPAPRLHIDDCSKIPNIHWELLWSAVMKSPKYSARSTAPPMRLLHGALVIFCPLTDISQFRSLGKWEKTLCLPKSTLLVGVGSQDGSWEELACESLRSGTPSSTRFSLNSCSHSGISEQNGSHRSNSWSSFFIWFWIFGWLGQRVSPFFPFNMCTWHRCWMGIYPLRSSLALVSLSLDTVVVGEVDELEEDVGWSISCLKGVIHVEEGKLEEELVDKPGTTIGTKFSMLHCIRTPF